MAVLRALWADPTPDFDGTWHTIQQPDINPRPKGAIPIWFGGRDPALIARAARLGDGWIPQVPASEAAAAVEDILDRREAAGTWSGSSGPPRGGGIDKIHGPMRLLILYME